MLLHPLDDFLPQTLVFCKYHTKNDYYSFGLFGTEKDNSFINAMCYFFEHDVAYSEAKRFTIINVIGSKVLNSLIKDDVGYPVCILEQEYFHPEIQDKWTDHSYAYHLSNTSWVVWYKRILYKMPYYSYFKKIFIKILPRSIKSKLGFDITYS